MIIRKLDDIIDTHRDIPWGNGSSRRFLISEDNMGYSLTDTIINEGTTSLLEYKNHLESCYCIEGEGEVISANEGKVHLITPGTMYALDKNDKHYLIAHTRMRLICVFSPALNGHERHEFKNGVSSHY